MKTVYDMNDFEVASTRFDLESREKWREWETKIPAFRFDPDWDVKIIPPFGGAMARFCIRHGDKFVSVYFDAYSRIGWMYDDNGNPEPYYEIYPDFDGDATRYYLNETDKMMEDIRAILNQ